MRKKLKVPHRSYMRVFAPDLSAGMNKFTDSRVLTFANAEAAYNVAVDSGALRNGWGVETAEIDAEFDRVFYYKVYDDELGREQGYYIGYSSEDGETYICPESGAGWNKIAGAHFDTPPMGVNYRLYGEDVFLLCGERGMAVVRPSLAAVTVTSAPGVTSLAMHNERMFVTIGGRRNAVWFSDDLDPTNWNPELDEGGFIELEGESGRLNKVVDFAGYVYIFRDYGISRLAAYGDQSDFSVSNLYVSSGKIYADTVAVCGDRILFYASDGLYSFDGLTSSRICRNLDGLIAEDSRPAACYSGGKYYLAAALASTEREPAHDMLAVIDPRKGTASVSVGFGVDSFSPIARASGEELLVRTCDGRTGKLTTCGSYFGESLTKVWRSGLADLGVPDRRKTVSEVSIDTEYDCTLTVSTERRSKSFALKGKREVQRRRVNLSGTKVQLEIKAQGDICAARPSVRYTVN